MTKDVTLKVGDPAPDFELMDENRAKVRLSGLRGKTVVLLFYPMDFSGVCTAEHCTFGAEVGRIAPDASTVVYGVNCDHSFSHAAYRKEHGIPYSLLADTSRQMVKDYGMYAGLEPFNCAKRGTVVIDPDGRIAAWEPTEMTKARALEDIVRYAKAARGR